jgi:two-component system response regulator NreC
MKTTILIADDHAILRSGLRMLIDSEPDMKVVGEAANVTEAVQKTRETNPNVLLLDVTMPERNGLSAIPALLKASPQTRILVLTMHDDPAYLQSALSAGASGYVVKSAAHEDLLTAIRAVTQGRTFLDLSKVSAATPTASERHASGGAIGREESTLLLSEREREVLTLVARGHTNQEVAVQLHVSVKSVETYRARLMEKLNLRTRAELVRYALEHGLLSNA